MLRTVNGINCAIDLGRYSVASLTSLVSRSAGQTAGERVYAIAQSFIGTPFQYETRLPLIGDNTVRVCLSSFDCVTFVYHVLALARSRTFPEYIDRLIELRYVDTEPRRISNDPSAGTIFDFACEALFEQAIRKRILSDVTDEIASPVKLLNISVTLAAIKRPKEHDATEQLVIPRFGERLISGNFIRSQHLERIRLDRVLPGDIIVFTLGAVNRDGSPRHLLIRHVAIALPTASDVHFIHATKDFYWRPDNSNRQNTISTGLFLNNDPRCELIGVGVAGAFAGDDRTLNIEGNNYFAYHHSRPRSLSEYARSNFIGVKFLRLTDN